MKYTITLAQDSSADCPTEDGTFQLHAFSSRHANHTAPEKLGIGLDADRNVVISGKHRVLRDRSLLFILSCYQHGNAVWSLMGEGPQCPWDTTQVAGALILDPVVFKGMHKDKKIEAARACLQEYNAWCNGEVYGYSIDSEEEGEEDSCWGFYDTKFMFERISDSVDFTASDEIEFDGDCAWLADHHSITFKRESVNT